MLKKIIPTTAKTRKASRYLRNNATRTERILWQELRKSKTGFKFRRQSALGPYVADFLCPEKMLIIEVDGGSHNEWKQIQHDLQRDDYLRRNGYRITRISTDRIKNALPSVVEEIKRELGVVSVIDDTFPTS